MSKEILNTILDEIDNMDLNDIVNLEKAAMTMERDYKTLLTYMSSNLNIKNKTYDRGIYTKDKKETISISISSLSDCFSNEKYDESFIYSKVEERCDDNIIAEDNEWQVA